MTEKRIEDFPLRAYFLVMGVILLAIAAAIIKFAPVAGAIFAVIGVGLFGGAILSTIPNA